MPFPAGTATDTVTRILAPALSSSLGRYSFFLYVNSEVPAHSVQELLAIARNKPGSLNYATGNPTGIVATGQMLSLAGVSMVQVPYARREGQARTA